MTFKVFIPIFLANSKPKIKAEYSVTLLVASNSSLYAKASLFSFRGSKENSCTNSSLEKWNEWVLTESMNFTKGSDWLERGPGKAGRQKVKQLPLVSRGIVGNCPASILRSFLISLSRLFWLGHGQVQRRYGDLITPWNSLYKLQQVPLTKYPLLGRHCHCSYCCFEHDKWNLSMRVLVLCGFSWLRIGRFSFVIKLLTFLPEVGVITLMMGVPLMQIPLLLLSPVALFT